MNKKISFFIAFSVVAFFASAQVKFGVEAGMNASQTVSGKSAKTNGMVSGFQVGGTVDYQFSKHWVLMSGLSFSQKGGELNQSLFVKGGDDLYLFAAVPSYDRISLKMNYLELPVKIGYSFGVCDKLTLIPSIGVYGAYGFNAGSSSLNAFYSDQETGKFTSVKWKPFDGYANPANANTALDKLNHLDFGGVVGLKAIVSDHFTASFNYSHSIKAIQKQMDLRNSSFQLSVGYRF